MRGTLPVVRSALCAVAIACAVPAFAYAEDQTSTSYQVLTPTVTAGGGYGTSDSYSLVGVISALSSATMTGTLFGMNPGFPAYPFVSTPAVSATGGAASATVSWTAATASLGYSVSGYAVGQGTASGGPYTFTSVGNVLTYAASGLTNGVPYYFVVHVLDPQGITIATSTEVSATPTAAVTPPPTPQTGGGGGGGGGSISTVPSGATVHFSGRAYPNSTVVLLKDGEIALSAPAGGDARFEFSLSGLSAGDYLFSTYGVDSAGNHSAMLSFPQTLSSGGTTHIGGLFVSPTIDVNKSEVRRGDNLTIFGKSAGDSAVTISIHSEPEFFVTTRSDKDGAYLYTLDTAALERGSHLAKSKASVKEEISNFGTSVGFLVGSRSVDKRVRAIIGDLANHGRVNLVDFSIMVFWFNRPLTAAATASDLNHDGKVNLVDLSILASHWTG